jgi:hypothetical protein
LFVEQAPNQSERRVICGLLRLFVDQVRSLFPTARFWVDGGFVTHKAEAPFDVDVACIVDPAEYGGVAQAIIAEQAAIAAAVAAGDKPPKDVLTRRFASLWTHTSVDASRAGFPGASFPAVQPFGSFVDAYLASDDPAVLAYWEDQWARHGDDYSEVKGFLELTP